MRTSGEQNDACVLETEKTNTMRASRAQNDACVRTGKKEARRNACW